MMSRQHFEAIAEAVRGAFYRAQPVNGHSCEYPLQVTAERLADVCQCFNPRFDRAKFLKACGVVL